MQKFKHQHENETDADQQIHQTDMYLKKKKTLKTDA
jgi:hypothetical protein